MTCELQGFAMTNELSRRTFSLGRNYATLGKYKKGQGKGENENVEQI